MKRKFRIYQLILFVGLISLLGGCGDHVTIEQKVEEKTDYIACYTYYRVETCVWVRNWMGYSVELVDMQIKLNVGDNVDEIKEAEYKRAIEIADKVQMCLDER